MENRLPMSSNLFALLCVQARAGRPLDLAGAGLHATFDQARTLAALMKGPGSFSLRNEGYDDNEMVELRLLGCRLTDDKSSGRPYTSPPDQQPIW